MTNPTRQEIKAAHEALEKLKDRALYAADFFGPVDACLLWKSEILKALPPEPQPTMADVEWDDDRHYLAEAEHKDGRTVIMLTRDSSTRINFIWNELIDSTYPQNLTPTGRLYTLKEVQ